MALNARTGSERGEHASPSGRLTVCEEELGAIAADVGGLAEELGRVRSYAHDVERALAERDEAILEQRQATVALEHENDELRERVRVASEALRSAEARIVVLDGQIDELGRENRTLRAHVAERERLRRRAEEESVHARQALADRERAFEHERSSLRRSAVATEQSQSRVPLPAHEPAAASAGSSTHDPEIESEAREATPSPLVQGHVRLVARSDGYRLVESSAPCPRSGERIDVEGISFVVIRTGRSPLPSDDRTCAFMLPA